MRPPKNFDNKMNRRKQLLPEVPQATAEDVGKVVKVGETGDYELGNDENTVIIANPDVETSEMLNKLTIGSTTYLVNEEQPITEIKAIRIIGKSMQGTDANIVLKRPIKLSNQYTGDIYSYQTGDAISCNIETASGLQNLITNDSLAECYIPAANLPIIIDIVFANKANIENYNVISIGCGPYQNASFKDVEVQVSADGTNFVSVLENLDIGFASEGYREVGKMYDVVPAIPTPTAADAGKVLSVDNNGAWELDNIPSELPTVTSADAGKVLTVNNQGAWGAENVPSGGNEEIFLINASVDACELRNGKTVGDIVNAIKNGKNVLLYGSQTDTLSDGRLTGEYYIANIGYTSGTMIIISFNTSNGSINIYQSANRTTSNKFNKVTT